MQNVLRNLTKSLKRPHEFLERSCKILKDLNFLLNHSKSRFFALRYTYVKHRGHFVFWQHMHTQFFWFESFSDWDWISSVGADEHFIPDWWRLFDAKVAKYRPQGDYDDQVIIAREEQRIK